MASRVSIILRRARNQHAQRVSLKRCTSLVLPYISLWIDSHFRCTYEAEVKLYTVQAQGRAVQEFELGPPAFLLASYRQGR